jgi:transcriptional regulator with XRE-family HTH domain
MNSNKNLSALLNKDYMPIIYKNIKKFRKESGMSLMEVAEILDMSHDYLRRIESNNDKIKTCSLKLLIKFSILYNKPLDDFLNE